MSQSHTDQLVSDFRLKGIPAFRGGDRDYETSAAAANLSFAYTRPGCVVQPETTEQVQYIIEQAKDVGENIIIKGGGHSYTGFSTTDGGVLVDMKRMTAVKLQLNKEKKPAAVKIQGGARWVDVYRTLVNGGWDGYVVVGGRCPAVGVGGFILGGGLGPFTREFGLGSDSLIEATIVTADGQKVTVGKEDMKDLAEGKDSDKGRLFWALRGAGSNVFGVVTEFRMKVQQLNHEEVVAGRFEWTPTLNTEEDRAKLMKTMRKFYTAKWPNEMTIDSNWMLDVKAKTGTTMKIRFSFYYNGTQQTFEKLVNNNEFIDNAELAGQLTKRSRAEPSTRFLHESLLLIWNEETRLFIPNQDENSYQKYSSFCFKNDGANIDKILVAVQDLQGRFKKALGSDEASFWTTFIHSGGQALIDPPKSQDILKEPVQDASKLISATSASTEELPGSSAYPWRETVYNTYVTIKFTDKWVEPIATQFLLDAKEMLKKFSIDGNAAYINFSDSAIKQKWGEAYYGKNWEQLKKIHTIWDPDHYFDWPWQKQEKDLEKWKMKKVELVEKHLLSGDSNRIDGWDLTDLAAYWSWNDKRTPVPVPPPSYEAAVVEPVPVGVVA